MENETLVNTLAAPDYVPITSITVIGTDMVVGKSAFFKATIAPSNASNCCVKWSSNNPSIATVNPDSGFVMARAKGSAIIYATACDGSCVVGSYNLTVTDRVLVENITLNRDCLILLNGNEHQISATVYPANATNKTVIWHSTNPSVATVNESGLVVPKAVGSTNILVTAQDGSSVNAHCSVLVQASMPGLKAKKQCYVYKVMLISDSTILKDADNNNVILETGDIVPLLSSSPISANNRVWYKILYNGMMLYVTADDESFKKTNVPMMSSPEGRDIFANLELDSDIDIRSTPFETNGNIIGQFAHGTNLTLTCNTPQNSEWFAVYGKNKNGAYSYGWCSGKYLAYYSLKTIRDCYVRTSMVISALTILKDSSGKSVVLRENTADSVRLWKLSTLTGGDYSDYNGNIRNDWYMVEYYGQIAYVTADSFYVFDFGEPLIDENQDNENINNTISQKEKIYAATVYAEAGGENYRSKQAVAHVMNNRIGTNSTWTDIEAVISAPYQFEGYGNPMYNEAINYYNSGICNNSIKKASMDECMEVIRPIYSGQSPDITGGALYFHSKPNASDWKYHNNYTLVTVEGTEKFWFYK